MNEVLTLAEIESQFPSEWILVEDPQTNEALEVQSGRVLHHAKIETNCIERGWSCAQKDLPCFTPERFQKAQPSCCEL
jgi:hypothetical protein